MSLATPMYIVPRFRSAMHRPSVTHDGKSIFWDSLRTGTLGGPDIWYATRSSTSEPWGQAIHLGQVSSGANDTRPLVSWDGRIMIISAANDIWFATRDGSWTSANDGGQR
jgi:hypothetical protein